MKKILCLILVITCMSIISYSQNEVYIISEVYTATSPTQPQWDSVYVTTPAGVTTGYSIPFITNVAAHDSELNQIINGVTSLGYEIHDWGQGRSYTWNSQPVAVFRWFLQKP